MASSKEITITVKGKITRINGEGKGSLAEKKVEEAKDSDSDGQTTLSNILHFAKSPIKSTLGKNVLLLEAYNQVKGNITQAVSTMWNRYANLKEDYMAQNNVNLAKGIIGRVAQYGTAALSGAMLGSAAGPIGAVVGAAVAVTGTFVSNLINYGAEISAYNEQNNALNIQTGYSRLRAGLVDGGRGTEN